MNPTGRFAFYSALVGFTLPLPFMAFYTLARLLGHEPNTTALAWFCPHALLVVFLQNRSVVAGCMVWLIICLANAALYAFPCVVATLILGFVNPTPKPPSILK